MNCQPTAEVIGIVKQSERRSLPTRQLVINSEPSPGCIGQVSNAFLVVMFAAAGRDRKDQIYHTVIVRHQKHLSIEIHFDVFISRVLWHWGGCIHYQV